MQDKINELIAKIKAIEPDTNTDRPTWNRQVLCSNGQDGEYRAFVSEQDTVGELKEFLEWFDDNNLICISQDPNWDSCFYVSAYKRISYTDAEYLSYLQGILRTIEPTPTCQEFRLPTGKVIQLTDDEKAALKEQLK